MDRRRHEERLESDLSVRDEVMDTLEQQAAATADMIRIPGGTFRMGSDRHYPEEAPVHSVEVDGFWIDPTPVTNAQFRAFVAGDRPRHLGRDPARCQGLSRRVAAHAEGGRPRLHAARQAGRSCRLEPVVALHLRRHLAAALRQGQPHRRARRSPGGADRLSRCRGLRQMGRQGTADRSRVGIRRPRRARRRGVRLGR